MGRLDGKVAVITGAASGIGRGTAEVFAKEGAKVVIADRDKERGCHLPEALGSEASFIRTDVASGPEIPAAVEHAVRRFGRLDIMFNNAGFGGARDGIAELTEEDWDATMAVAEWVNGHALVVDGGVMTGTSWNTQSPMRDELRALAGEG
jgi:NAD(P)-dependent dehydrogenase (short-subunit alcohol dehydrogenase family)